MVLKSVEEGEGHGLDRRRQWLHLTPDLVEALEGLAAKEHISLEKLLISLINEALVHRLRQRS